MSRETEWEIERVSEWKLFSMSRETQGEIERVREPKTIFLPWHLGNWKVVQHVERDWMRDWKSEWVKVVQHVERDSRRDWKSERAENYFFVKFIYKNVWTSDKSWEPGMFLKTWKPENFENIKNDLWDMLNNFCFHVYAQKSLFIGQNVNVFFYLLVTPWH